jgi:hypothetical protein
VFTPHLTLAGHSTLRVAAAAPFDARSPRRHAPADLPRQTVVRMPTSAARTRESRLALGADIGQCRRICNQQR